MCGVLTVKTEISSKTVEFRFVPHHWNKGKETAPLQPWYRTHSVFRIVNLDLSLIPDWSLPYFTEFDEMEISNLPGKNEEKNPHAICFSFFPYYFLKMGLTV